VGEDGDKGGGLMLTSGIGGCHRGVGLCAGTRLPSEREHVCGVAHMRDVRKLLVPGHISSSEAVAAKAEVSTCTRASEDKSERCPYRKTSQTANVDRGDESVLGENVLLECRAESHGLRITTQRRRNRDRPKGSERGAIGIGGLVGRLP
jgi:hypothetical protein